MDGVDLSLLRLMMAAWVTSSWVCWTVAAFMTGDAADHAIEVADVTADAALEATAESELKVDLLAELAKMAMAEDEAMGHEDDWSDRRLR